MEYNFKTLDFEGPLDLLLHLIKESNMDIFEIKISEITEQYLKYISKMEELNLNISSEYLVMAADLIEMKSRELLPKHEEEEEEEDPKEELINRLVEYQKYKEASQKFKELEQERMNYYSKPRAYLEEYQTNTIELEEELTLEDLIKAFEKFKERKELEKPLNTVVTKKEYSIHKRSEEIMNKLHVKKKITFEELFDIYTKNYVVVTFLSILDLAKKGNLIIKQENNLDEITLLAKEVKE